jgi:carboxypeptidase Taq
MDRSTALAELRAWWREGAVLASCASVLAWDEEACMPRKGAAHRAEQQAVLAGLVHDRTADPCLGEWLAALEEGPAGDGLAAADVREARRLRDHALATPRRLVQELARVTTLAQEAWVAARDAGDHARFAPWLDHVVALKRDEAACLARGGSGYDALLDGWEPGLSMATLRPLLRDVAEGARGLLAGRDPAAGEQPARRRAGAPAAAQLAFVEEVARALGFDRSRGRIDTATHPSTIAIGPGDNRMTVRVDEADATSALLTTLHELGHWLYDSNLDPTRWGTPAGDALSLGLHESQARLVENHVGRSAGFWAWCWPRARAALGASLDRVTTEDVVRDLQRVAPGPVRVGADEVTYGLHIVLRVELEEALLQGDVDAAGLPAAWREATRRHLGVDVPDDLRGCLQDGHWSAGMFGYFPTYLLGDVAAAQLVAAARVDLGDLDEAFARGEFAPLVGWLRERVHRHGTSERLPERVRLATGRPLDAQAHLAHLRGRYGGERT